MGFETQKLGHLFRVFTLLPLISSGAFVMDGEPCIGVESPPAIAVSSAPTQSPKVQSLNQEIAVPSTPSSDSEVEAFSQLTSVVQLSDVQPTDWAFQALRSLVERYGVIAGFPDRTFRGDRPLTRDEFAAGLNSALNRLNERVAAGTADRVTEADLETIQRLQEGFAAELASLRGRVDALESRTANLKAQQFSPTTKLRAFSLFLAADTFGRPARTSLVRTTQAQTQPFLANYTRLSLLSSFTGKDLLTTSFTTGNIPLLSLSTGTPMTNFVTDPTLNFPANALFLDRLNYQFPIGDRTTVWIGIRSLQPFEFFPTVNPVITSLDGPISRFSWFNPGVYRPGFDGTGPGLAYKISKTLQLHLAYLAAGGLSSDPTIGFFNSSSTVVSQLTFTPTPQITAAFTYAHKYFRTDTANLFGLTGSPFALQPFGLNPTTSDNFGLQFNWRITRRFSFGGWFGYTLANQLNASQINATILNGSFNLTLQDVLQRGDRGGLIFGLPPKVTSSDYVVGGTRRVDLDTSLHLEVFYTHRFNDNVSITPNLYVITNPNHNADNPTLWVAVLRTSFGF